MKKTLFNLLFLGVIICFGKAANAQSYQTAAGVRFSYESGPSIKYFTSPTVAIEAVLGFRTKGAVVTGLFEIHQTAFNVAELKFYYGAGAHLGYVGSGVYRINNSDNRLYSNSSPLLGVDGVIGLEYLLPNTPIAVNVDLDPRIEIFRGSIFNLTPSIGIKYAFK